VALACGASEEGRWSGRESLRAARLDAAQRHIDGRLAEPRLTPASTAAALGISVRHLYLLFEPTGTSFAQYVKQRRLLQCRATLASRTGLNRSVADIALGWGFNSLATFYRALSEIRITSDGAAQYCSGGVRRLTQHPSLSLLHAMRCCAALNETTRARRHFK
jgi:AraC-like DNA-binding protein